MATPALVARVLIDSPLPQLDRLFDYGIPDALMDAAIPGVRVRVPLRSAGRIADGFIVEITDAGGYTGTLSDLESVVSDTRVLTPEVWALARRLADRAAGNAIDIVRLAVPKRQVRVEKAWAMTGEPSTVTAHVVPDYDQAAIDALLGSRGRAAIDAVPYVVPLRSGEWVGHWASTLARIATRVVASGASAILAVPDHRDQRQLVEALADLLPADRVVQLDARQSNPDRYRAFLACLGDEPLVIVGNRSVVYAPAARLGLIAVWDDGDPLHTEPLSPYVTTRDAALVRQEQQDCALVIMSHTRTTDVERLVEIGWMQQLAPVRIVPPRVIPTAQQQAQDRLAAQARIPSSAWREARAALEHGPVLVQVARPGYAPKLVCATCGEAAHCAFCGGPLGTRAAGAVPACLWCGRLATNWSCDNCQGTALRQVGQGATRTAEDLGRAFPGVKVVIADGERQILTVGAEPALVVATRGAEPIAAGGYRAVLLLDGERMLARESLRVAEDCLRWWTNAIALSAPGAPSILVGVGGALASALATWRIAEYARRELVDRRRLRFPPAVRAATVTGDAASVDRALKALPQTEQVDVLGPVDVESTTGVASVRAIVRFDLAQGAAVAAALRAEVIRNATSRRKRVPASGRPSLPTLKVRFDDPEPFDL